MSAETYAAAVEAFEVLISQPLRDTHDTPAALIRAAGLAQSTGYRHVATLEAEGFLRRGRSGTYLPGLAAVRTGLSAVSAGQIAPVVEPVVTQLREVSQHTAFLGTCEDMSLYIGPHSVGRETRTHRIHPRYLLESFLDAAPGEMREIGMHYLDTGIARRAAALIVPLASPNARRIVLGLFLGGHRSDHAMHSGALRGAYSRIERIVEPGA